MYANHVDPKHFNDQRQYSKRFIDVIGRFFCISAYPSKKLSKLLAFKLSQIVLLGS